jgi:Icc-related predicted phosphoesterase
MKLLLFSDLHCDAAAAERLVAQAVEADVLVGAGDFAQTRRGIQTTLEILQRVTQPAVLVPGNSESDAELRAACRQWPSAHVLHGTGVTVQGVDFWGIGGGIPPTPFGSWSFDLSEREAETLLADAPRECVLVTHSPPQGSVDLNRSGRHLGSSAIRRAIERTQPRLVVCGHVHESWRRQAQVGSTPVVNAGPRGWLWDLA